MRAMDVYALITTPELAAVRDFYVRSFEASTAFEASWILVLALNGAEGTKPFTLAFMHPDHPSSPPGPAPFDGKGMILTIQVESADRAHAALEARGAPILYGPVDEPWGQRRFMTRDPARVLIDVVEQIAPQEGFWERYAA